MYLFQSHSCCNKRELVGLLQQSIPFYVELVYILVHFTKFSFINFVVLNAEKSSSLHTIILEKQNTNQATHCLDFQSSMFSLSLGLDTLFFLQSILTLIVQTTVSAVSGTFSKQQQGALKVSFWSIFC